MRSSTLERLLAVVSQFIAGFRVLRSAIIVLQPISLGDELQDVDWHSLEVQYAIVGTSDDRLRQAVDGSVHIAVCLERLDPGQGCIYSSFCIARTKLGVLRWLLL